MVSWYEVLSWDTSLRWFCPTQTDSSSFHNFSAAVKLGSSFKKKGLKGGFSFLVYIKTPVELMYFCKCFDFYEFQWMAWPNLPTYPYISVSSPVLFTGHLNLPCYLWEKTAWPRLKKMQKQSMRFLHFLRNKLLAQSPNLKLHPWIK